MWKQIVLSLLIFHSCGNYLYMQDCLMFIFISFAYPIAFFRPLLHFNKKCKSKPALSWIIKIRRWYYYHFAYHRFNYLYIMNLCSGCHRTCWIPKGCKWTSVIWKIWYLYENVKRNHQWMLRSPSVWKALCRLEIITERDKAKRIRSLINPRYR